MRSPERIPRRPSSQETSHKEYWENWHHKLFLQAHPDLVQKFFFQDSWEDLARYLYVARQTIPNLISVLKSDYFAEILHACSPDPRSLLIGDLRLGLLNQAYSQQKVREWIHGDDVTKRDEFWNQAFSRSTQEIYPLFNALEAYLEGEIDTDIPFTMACKLALKPHHLHSFYACVTDKRVREWVFGKDEDGEETKHLFTEDQLTFFMMFVVDTTSAKNLVRAVVEKTLTWAMDEMSFQEACALKFDVDKMATLIVLSKQLDLVQLYDNPQDHPGVNRRPVLLSLSDHPDQHTRGKIEILKSDFALQLIEACGHTSLITVFTMARLIEFIAQMSLEPIEIQEKVIRQIKRIGLDLLVAVCPVREKLRPSFSKSEMMHLLESWESILQLPDVPSQQEMASYPKQILESMTKMYNYPDLQDWLLVGKEVGVALESRFLRLRVAVEEMSAWQLQLSMPIDDLFSELLKVSGTFTAQEISSLCNLDKSLPSHRSGMVFMLHSIKQNPDLARFELEMRHKKLPASRNLNWSQRIEVFDSYRQAMGFTGTDHDLNQLVVLLWQFDRGNASEMCRDLGIVPVLESKEDFLQLSEPDKRKVISYLRRSYSEEETLVLRQKVLPRVKALHPHLFSPEDNREPEYWAQVEDTSSPKAHLQVTIGFEIEHEVPLHLTVPHFYLLSNYGLKRGNDAGNEFSPGPWIDPETAQYVHRLWIDAGMMDYHRYHSQYLHLNWGCRSEQLSVMMERVWQGTGRAYRKWGEALSEHSSIYTKQVNGIYYMECKQFKYLNPESFDQQLLNMAVTGMAQKAYEKVLMLHKGLDESELMEFKAKKLLTKAQIQNSTAYPEIKQLAMLFTEMMSLVKKGLRQAKVEGVLETSTSSERYFFAQVLGQVFPTIHDHFRTDVDSVEVPLGKIKIAKGTHIGQEVLADDLVFHNFVSFLRYVVEECYVPEILDVYDQVDEYIVAELKQIQAIPSDQQYEFQTSLSRFFERFPCGLPQFWKQHATRVTSSGDLSTEDYHHLSVEFLELQKDTYLHLLKKYQFELA